MQFLLGKENSFSIPSWLIPRASRHSDSYVVRCPFISLLTDSLSSVVRWLGGIAEEKGVDVFSDTPVAGLLLQDNKAVGVVTQDKGLDAQGRPTDIYQRGYEIGGKSVLLAEGVLRKGKAKEGGKRMQKSSTRAQDSTRGKLAAGSLRALLPYWMSWMHWRRMSSLAVMGSARSCSIH